jgi:hypothetical protein
MTTDIGVKKPGALVARSGLWIAGIAAFLLIAVTLGGGTVSLGLIAIVAAGLVIAGIGFAIRVVAALENR